MWILPPKFGIQVDTQGVSPQDQWIFHTDLGSLDHPYRENLKEQTYGCCLPFPVRVGPSIWSQPQGKLRLKNDLQARAFRQWVTLPTQNADKAILLQGRKGINREGVFRPLSTSNCLASETWDLQVCPEDLTSRIRAVCLPAFLCAEKKKHIPKPLWDWAWGSRLQECVWEWWMPSCGHQVMLTLHWKWAHTKGLRYTLLLQKSQRMEQS